MIVRGLHSDTSWLALQRCTLAILKYQPAAAGGLPPARPCLGVRFGLRRARTALPDGCVRSVCTLAPPCSELLRRPSARHTPLLLKLKANVH